jgi:hypothetical protein
VKIVTVEEEDHPSLEEDDEDLKRHEAVLREEKRLHDEAVARADQWEVRETNKTNVVFDRNVIVLKIQHI